MLVGAGLLDVITAQGQIRGERSSAILGTVDSFNQPIRRNHQAVCSGNIFGSKQSKLYRCDLAVHAELEPLVLLQHLVQADFYLLPFIPQTGAGLGDLHFLSSVGQLYRMRFRVQYRAKGGLDFLHRVLPQVEGFRGNRAVLGGREGGNHIASRIAQGAVGGDDILGGGHLVDSTCESGFSVNRLVAGREIGFIAIFIDRGTAQSIHR